MEIINRILVVSWLSRHCDETIKIGISLAQKYKAEVSVVHIIDTTWISGLGFPAVSLEEERRKDREAYRVRLHKLIDEEKHKGMAIKEVVKEGIPPEVILKLIKEENIDLLVLRSHEESRLERLLIGSINDEIIRAMPCSIYLFKQGTCPI